MADGLTEHYGGAGLVAAFERGLGQLGVSAGDVTVEQLGVADEFHIGGRVATERVVDLLELDENSQLLDLGSGIGGPARVAATRTGCSVNGVDLTPAYVEAARTFTEWVGLDQRVRFEIGSVLELPFDDASHDAAMQLHVGMNIEAKADLFIEVARVLRPGARFCIYDVADRIGGDDNPSDLVFPMPWASTPAQSFVTGVDAYVDALESAGFDVEVTDRHQFAVEFFQAQRAAAAKNAGDGPPPLGLHLLLGPDTPAKLGNLGAAVHAGRLGPVEFLATKR